MDPLLKYALAIATRMSKDPEVRSLAHEAWWRATVTFDPNRGTPLRIWVCHLVKQSVHYWWRKTGVRLSREVQASWDGEGTEELLASDLAPPCYDEPTEPLKVPRDDWELLCEHLIDRWPLDVIAKRRGATITSIRDWIAQAKGRFLDAYGKRTPEVP